MIHPLWSRTALLPWTRSATRIRIPLLPWTRSATRIRIPLLRWTRSAAASASTRHLASSGSGARLAVAEADMHGSVATVRSVRRFWASTGLLLAVCAGCAGSAEAVSESPDAPSSPSDPELPGAEAPTPAPIPDTAPAAGDHIGCEVALPSQRPADGTPLPADVSAAVLPHWDAVQAGMSAGDVDAVARAVCDARAALGTWQGVAEAALSYRATTADPVSATALVQPFVDSLVGLYGTEPWVRNQGSTHGDDMTEALRTSCGIIRGYALAATFADSDQADQLLTRARVGADWLLAVQRPEGHWGFPDLTDDAAIWLAECAATGASASTCEQMLPRVYELAMLGKRRWEALGRPAGVLVDGWFVNDSELDPGGLQFDTGECGNTLLTVYQVSDDERYLAAARRAGAWAAAETPVGNWNYNAFSVDLLAGLAAVDPESAATTPGGTDWAQAGLDKARLGVMPGALSDGRWVDAHNARLVYHMILLRALAHLDQVVDDAQLTTVVAAANQRSSDEIRQNGAAAFDDGIDAHLATRRLGYPQNGTVERLVNGALPGGRPDSLSLAAWIADELDLL